MRHTRSQTGQRRSHHALTSVSISLCQSCGSPKMNHRACVNCGKYNKREVINVFKELDKKTAKAPKAETKPEVKEKKAKKVKKVAAKA